jgi:methanogenic corrinoid protein MtbC1
MDAPLDVLDTLDAEGLTRFRALRQAAIDAVTQRFYAEQGGIYERFGQAGRDACREDLAYHLEFLQPVLEFGVLQPMVDYLRWLASVLQARDIPAEHIAQSVDWLADFFQTQLDGQDARIVATALHAARDRFLALGAVLLAPDDSALEMHAPEAWPECGVFEDALLAGNQRAALQVFDSMLDAGRNLIETEMHVVQPALYRIGRKWQANQVSVAQEHLSTAISRMAMTRGLLKSEPPRLNGRRVVLACVQGNEHAVGLQMVADAFELGGWDVQFLGANVPTASLVSHVVAARPDLLGLSVSFVQQLRVVKDIVARVRKLPVSEQPRIMVGGLAINRFDSLATLLGADAWSANAVAALDTGNRLVAERARA